MATSLLKAEVTAAWSDVIGAAAGQVGVTWQNIGSEALLIAFTTSAPDSDDAIHQLQPGEAFYDKNGSVHVWARDPGGSPTPTYLSATKD